MKKIERERRRERERDNTSNIEFYYIFFISKKKVVAVSKYVLARL